MNAADIPTCLTGYNCYTHWWMALPAVPPDRTSLDWWASADGRCSRYERLKRVWSDPTRLTRPKHDPMRPHEFGMPTHGTHRLCRTWENFVLFPPDAWVPVLLQAAGFECTTPLVDCCWSYEFEATVGATKKFKLADVVLHARDADGRDLLLVVEAKAPGDRLKEKCQLPDTAPGSYLDRDAFLHVKCR